MAIKSGIVALDVRGGKQVVLKLNQFQRNLLSGLFSTGRDVMKVARLEAQQIIRELKAPNTTEALEKAMFIQVSFTGKQSVKYELVNQMPYATKVHSGYAPYIERNISSSLLKWVKDNLGDGFAKTVQNRGYIKLGFPSNARKYNPQQGMRFFDKPFAEITRTAPEKYYQMVDQVRIKTNL